MNSLILLLLLKYSSFLHCFCDSPLYFSPDFTYFRSFYIINYGILSLFLLNTA
ncbi:uncharacterized protein RHIMIDRAFT_10614, partial [Rhizopus microsporus ATCC 52813]